MRKEWVYGGGKIKIKIQPLPATHMFLGITLLTCESDTVVTTAICKRCCAPETVLPSHERYRQTNHGKAFRLEYQSEISGKDNII